MEQEYNYKQIMAAGEEVARVMQSPVFQYAYNAVINELTGELFNTEPGHTRTLEEIRRRGNSLAYVMGRFKSHWDMAEAEYAAQNQNKPQPNAPDEYQGYGINQ